jgi:multidrug transporter EmrE-like cation transporter
MTGISPLAVAMFGASIALQLVMIATLPSSHGYTKPLPTAVIIVCMNVAVYLFALLVARGVQLSILFPISSAMIPLGAIALGVWAHGEPAPWPKIILLVLASVMVGIASGLK